MFQSNTHPNLSLVMICLLFIQRRCQWMRRDDSKYWISMSKQVDVHCTCYFGHLSRETEANHEGCRGGQSVAVDLMDIFTVCEYSDDPGLLVFDSLLLYEWSLLESWRWRQCVSSVRYSPSDTASYTKVIWNPQLISVVYWVLYSISPLNTI
jgi:hypothetical protein